MDTLAIALMTGGHHVLDTRWRGHTPHEPYARLYAIVDGTATITHHQCTFVLRPNRLYLIPPNAGMRFACAESVEILWVHFRVLLDGALDLFEACDCRYEMAMPAPAATRAAMLDMLRAFEDHGMAAAFRAKGALLRLLAPLITERPRPEPANAAARRLRPLLDYIAAHLHEPLRVSDLARRAGYETNYFGALFRAAFGVPPLLHIHQRRIAQARLRLVGTDETIEAIAGALGFCDAFHFSKTFRRLTGCAPSAYRAAVHRARP